MHLGQFKCQKWWVWDLGSHQAISVSGFLKPPKDEGCEVCVGETKQPKVWQDYTHSLPHSCILFLPLPPQLITIQMDAVLGSQYDDRDPTHNPFIIVTCQAYPTWHNCCVNNPYVYCSDSLQSRLESKCDKSIYKIKYNWMAIIIDIQYQYQQRNV